MRTLIIILILSFCSCESKLDTIQLKENLIKNQESFEELINYFTANIHDKNLIVTFGVESPNRISLHYYFIIGNIDTIFGGEDMKLHSPELDKAIKDLGWSYRTLDSLTEGLKKINCEFLRNTDWYGKPINIYNQATGFSNSAYNIYPESSADTLHKLDSTPVGQTSFLKRAYIMTSSAL